DRGLETARRWPARARASGRPVAPASRTCGYRSDTSSRIDWSPPGTVSAAASPRRPADMLAPCSERRDDGRTRAADLRKISAAGALPVEDDPLAARKRAVWIRIVRATGQRAATRTAAATQAVDARRGRASRGGEFVRLDDVATGALEIGDRQATGGAIPARQAPAGRGEGHGRSARA